MALPPFASTEDVAARIPGGLASSDEDRAEAALEDIAAVIRAEAGKTWTDEDGALVADFPAILKVISITAARRELDNPDAVISETIDGYSQRLANASTGVYLTPKEAKLVRRAAGRGGLWSQQLTRGVVETSGTRGLGDDDEYIEVVGSEPFPFLPG